MNPEHLRGGVGTTGERTAFTPPGAPWWWWDTTLGTWYYWDGAAWQVIGSATDHGALLGLGDDDHAQYALADKSRPATWVEAADLAARSIGDLGTKDHDLLDGLADDDHTQYSLVDGTRAFTGEVGGVAPTLDAHLATKGYVDDLPNWENTIVVAKSGGDYTTITAAIAAAANGDIILICPGTYSESFTIAADVSLFGFGQEQTVVDGTITIAAGADSITLTNIYVNDSKSESGTLYGINVTGGSYIWIRNCRVELTNTHATGAVTGINNTGSSSLYVVGTNVLTQTVPGAGTAIGVRASGGTIVTFVRDCYVAGETYDFQQASSGMIHVALTRYDPTKVSGTLTPEISGRWGIAHLPVNETDVSNPPTDGELDAIFGNPADAGEGFAAIVNDNGGDTNIYLVAAVGPKWVYWTGTIA